MAVSIRARVLTGLAGLACIAVAVSLAMLVLSRQAIRSLDTASHEVLRYIQQVEEAQVVLDKLHETLVRSMVAAVPDLAKEGRNLDLQSVRFLDLVETIHDPTPAGNEQQQALVHSFQAYHLLAKQILPPSRPPETVAAFLERATRLDRQLEIYLSHHARNTEDTLLRVRSELAFMSTLSGAAGLTSLLITLSLALIVSRRLGRPLRQLLQAAKNIGEGDLEIPALGSPGDEIGLVGAAFNEMTERLRQREADRDHYESALRRTQTLEAIGRLAGGIAHDFNNLLGSIVGCVYAARDTFGEHAKAAGELDRIQDLCKQGGEVTRHLLTVAGESPGTVSHLDLRRELLQLKVLVERACGKSLTVAFDLQKNLPRVRGDRALVNAILLNLCLNARDAMSSGGELSVVARREEVDGRIWAAIAVHDTGQGIPRELLDRLFQPFFTTKHKDRGAGLGLSTALAMAQQMGGTIDVESEAGQGATFTLRLLAWGAPTEDPHSVALPPFKGAALPTEIGPVLLVEDEEDIARMMADALNRHGCKTLHARTGLDALELIRENGGELSLVLLDLMLPEFSGAALQRVLKATVPSLPVVFVTGREDLAAEEDPSAPVLRKPFSEHELLSCVRVVADGEPARSVGA